MRKHFRKGIETGATELNAKVGSLMVATILGMDPPKGVEAITDENIREPSRDQGRAVNPISRRRLAITRTCPGDPDKFDADQGFDAQRESRQRVVPSGLANEIYLDVFERLASFEPGVHDLNQRLFDAYAAEVRRVSGNDDGIIAAAQAIIDTATERVSG